MTRLNGIALPQHEAAARQQSAAIAHMRFQASASIVGQLLQQQLDAQAKRIREARGDSDDGANVSFDATQAIDTATNLAISAADTLLEKLGFMEG